ncbi:MAG TPA: glycosyltransferase family 87 protein [Chloroflexota bacterium]
MWWRAPRAAITCLLAAYALGLLLLNPFLGAEPPLGDFGSFYASGLAATEGLDPYRVYPLTMNAAVNLNPPPSLLLFAPLTMFPPGTGRTWWFIATVLAVVATVIVLRVGPPYRPVWVLASAPFWETVSLGQIYALLALPASIAWVLVDRRPVVSGLLMGLVAAIKPNFLLWPGLLAISGERRVAVVAFGTWAALNAVAAAVFGPSVFGQWLAVISQEGANGTPANAALAGVLARVGWPAAIPVVDVLGVVGLVVLVLGRRPTPRNVSSLALIGLLVFSPLAWVGYGLFLLPLFFARPWTPMTTLAAALLLLPRPPLTEWSVETPILAHAYSLAWLILLSQQVQGLLARQAQAPIRQTSLRGTPAPS